VSASATSGRQSWPRTETERGAKTQSRNLNALCFHSSFRFVARYARLAAR
jgi:hypothetical protein